MEYTMEERAVLIIEAVKKETGRDPVAMFEHVVANDFVRMHGPEHHVVDGACILQAYHNAGGAVDIDAALKHMITEGLRMPGGICGNWGVCGAVSSVGTAMSFLDRTSLTATDDSWGKHMLMTSEALHKLGEIGGPRCCKRDGIVAIMAAVKYINENTPVHLDASQFKCHYSPINKQCIGERCPFHQQ